MTSSWVRRNLFALDGFITSCCLLIIVLIFPSDHKYDAVADALNDLMEAEPDAVTPTFVRLGWHASGTYDAAANRYGTPECALISPHA